MTLHTIGSYLHHLVLQSIIDPAWVDYSCELRLISLVFARHVHVNLLMLASRIGERCCLCRLADEIPTTSHVRGHQLIIVTIKRRLCLKILFLVYVPKVVGINELERLALEAYVGAEASTSQSNFLFKRDEEFDARLWKCSDSLESAFMTLNSLLLLFSQSQHKGIVLEVALNAGEDLWAGRCVQHWELGPQEHLFQNHLHSHALLICLQALSAFLDIEEPGGRIVVINDLSKLFDAELMALS